MEPKNKNKPQHYVHQFYFKKFASNFGATKIWAQSLKKEFHTLN